MNIDQAITCGHRNGMLGREATRVVLAEIERLRLALIQSAIGRDRQFARIHTLIADDAFAITYQSFGGYRSALLAELEKVIR